MIDVSPKFNSLRYALAEGFLYGSPKTLKRIFAKTVPKGDVAEVARAAGIHAAKFPLTGWRCGLSLIKKGYG